MGIQATAIYRRTAHSAGMPGGGEFGLTEVVAEDQPAAISRAERVGRRLGDLFAVAWDLEETPEGQEAPRRVKMADGREMTWAQFAASHGAEIGLP